MASTFTTEHDLTPGHRAEFERFKAIVDSTPFTPFPLSELREQDRRAQSMRNSHLIEGIESDPLSDAMDKYFLEKRVSGDDASKMLVQFYKQV